MPFRVFRVFRGFAITSSANPCGCLREASGGVVTEQSLRAVGVEPPLKGPLDFVTTEYTVTPSAARKAADEDYALHRKPPLIHGIM